MILLKMNYKHIFKRKHSFKNYSRLKKYKYGENLTYF